MLLKIGRFEAKTVLSNQALANEQLSFLCDFSFLFAVHDAGSGEGAVSLSHMVQMLLHATNPCPWPPQCTPAQGTKAAGESQGLSGGPAHLLGVRKPFLREPPKQGEWPFRKSTSSLLKSSWMQLQRDTDTTAEDEGKAPWSRDAALQPCCQSAFWTCSGLEHQKEQSKRHLPHQEISQWQARRGATVEVGTVGSPGCCVAPLAPSRSRCHHCHHCQL